MTGICNKFVMVLPELLYCFHIRLTIMLDEVNVEIDSGTVLV